MAVDKINCVALLRVELLRKSWQKLLRDSLTGKGRSEITERESERAQREEGCVHPCALAIPLNLAKCNVAIFFAPTVSTLHKYLHESNIALFASKKI